MKHTNGAAMNSSDSEDQPVRANERSLLATYDEICKSYHAIDTALVTSPNGVMHGRRQQARRPCAPRQAQLKRAASCSGPLRARDASHRSACVPDRRQPHHPFLFFAQTCCKYASISSGEM
jgi:hypothetical protein